MASHSFNKNDLTPSWRTAAQSALVILLVTAGLAKAQPNTQSGTTLAAYKTLDICVRTDGKWKYFGEIAVWNSGSVDTEGLNIFDHVQNKISGSDWSENPSISQILVPTGTIKIPAGTTQAAALTFPYNMLGDPLTGDIRNVVDVTILNHSGHITYPATPWGPQPKATYTGLIPPPPCNDEIGPGGCAYTRGYWGNKPDVGWPAPYNQSTLFYWSGKTYLEVLTAPASGNGYYILGPQFIAAQLNVANGASVPQGVQDTLALAGTWFANPANTPALCDAKGSCGLQKDWGAVLDDYNNGVYPGGPPHCN